MGAVLLIGGHGRGATEGWDSSPHTRPTGTGIAGNAVTRAESPDEFARNADSFGHEIRGQVACPVARLRMIQHVEQYVDFPTMQVSVGRPAQFLADAKEALDADELTEQTAVSRPNASARNAALARTKEGLAGLALFVLRQASTSWKVAGWSEPDW